MRDYIVRATAAGNQIRAFAATTRDLVEAGRAAHKYEPGSHSGPGKAADRRGYDGSYDEGGQRSADAADKSGGPLNGITVTADSKGNVKKCQSKSSKIIRIRLMI